MEKQVKPLKILITGIGGDIGQGVVKCLKDYHIPLTVVGVDVCKFPATRDKVAVFRQVPLVSDKGNYGMSIDELIAEEHPDLLLPLSEPEIEYFSSNRDRYASQVKLMVNNPEIIKTFMDKHETIKFYENVGVRVPKTFRATEFSGQQIPYPIIVKSKRGCGAKGNRIIRNHDEFATYEPTFS